MHVSIDEIRRLSVAERLQLVEETWDSISSEVESSPLTEKQRRELDRRLDVYERNPTLGATWAEVWSRLRKYET